MAKKKEKPELEEIFEDNGVYGMSFDIYRGNPGLGAKVFREPVQGRADAAEIRLWIGRDNKVDLYLTAPEIDEIARRFKLVARVLRSRNKARAFNF